MIFFRLVFVCVLETIHYLVAILIFTIGATIPSSEQTERNFETTNMSDRYPEIQALYDSRFLEERGLPQQNDEIMSAHQPKLYAGHALFIHKNQVQSQESSTMNMSHVADALPFEPPLQQRAEAVPWLYYQQPPPPRLLQATQGHFDSRRSYPPYVPAIVPFSNATGSSPYPHYYPYYQASLSMAPPYPIIQRQGRAQAQQSYAMSKDTPLTPYNEENLTYPSHMAQIMQDHRFSSSGSNATAGSSPEQLAAQSSSPEKPSTSDSTSIGPPRKPRQSGHALWVGNLPPTANVSDLKDHFSRSLTTDIESLKLIAKSNCALVNYHSAAACAVAMQRFHDSRFHGARLVCRLRRTSDPNVAPDKSKRASITAGDAQQVGNIVDSTERVPDRFFVLKSLTVQDLETSLRTGQWATQAHNEAALTTAYTSADNVYLIFSANKSGEYFGYARMASAITSSEPSVRPILTPQTSGESSQTQLTPMSSVSGSPPSSITSPRIITTPATEWAPRGKIIEDHARGTIFWEADLDNSSEPAPAVEGDALTRNQPRNATTNGGASDNGVEYLPSSGSSFSVDWISTTHVPFYTTRGLRNPWNNNREVKIARDGTELEPVVGRKLLALFSHPGIGGGRAMWKNNDG